MQGYAGTAKTTTVLATFAREAGARGVPVVALAPTASAAMVLGEALGTRGDTVAHHLLSPGQSAPGAAAIWIVDEASLLSARELQVLEELTKGASNKNIARNLGISAGTVRVHVKSLLRKLELDNRTQAAVWAIATGFGVG